jgi:hypothetical protein
MTIAPPPQPNWDRTMRMASDIASSCAARSKSQAGEVWYPRCPRCSASHLVLAQANGFTKHLIDKAEVYCTECQWRGVLAAEIKRVYVRS